MGKGPKASLGCLFWIAIILLAVVLFLFNKNAIMDIIERFQNTDGKKPLITLTSPPPPENVSGHSPQKGVPVSPAPSPAPTPDKAVEGKTTTGPSATHTPAPSSSPRISTTRTSTLYFISRTGNDVLVLKGVQRQVVHQDAPLTATLRALIEGPSSTENHASLMSLIPKNSRLRDVAVRGDTAYLSFSEDFRFNEYGVPGLQAQVKQIVYTATDFPNVKKVQFLIEGKKVDYLAQEGVFIGAPLSRTSF
jgi:germination protein M